MCGIIGYVGKQNCTDFLVQGLKRLEYRGYDSAGIAVRSDKSGGTFEVLKAGGKLENIEKLLKQTPLAGAAGIGHTRWATHGKPNSINAHPHQTGNTILVHNGIIENYEDIRQKLISKGYKMVSETDSELFGYLVEEELKKGTAFEESVREAFLLLEGSCTIVVVNQKYPDRFVAIRNGTPLIAAFSKKSEGSFVASDPAAILDHTNEITYLENEEMVVGYKDHFDVFNFKKPISSQKPIVRNPVVLDWTLGSMEKEGYAHYMLKEIHEQPRAVLDTLDNLVDREKGEIKFGPSEPQIRSMIARAKKIQIIGCGTAWHAALVGEYILESSARVSVEVELASEYRYRKPIVDADTLVLLISQSGETADTLAALREAKKNGAMTMGICNVRGSTLSREADFTLFSAAGPEIGVASTKAFTTQVLILMMLGQYAASARNANQGSSSINVHTLSKLVHQIEGALQCEKQVAEIARQCLQSKGFLFIARGKLFPIALEGALKLKEISYVHAEGFPAGELKHGPIAMVDESMTVVVLAPRDELYEKTISNLQEVRARGGKILSIGSKGDQQLQKLSDYFLGFSFEADWSDTLLSVVPLQFLSYYTALYKGADIDKPRNLAKSVTVE